MAFRVIVTLGLAGLLTQGIAPAGEDDAPSEYQIKAAFLFNFAKFVEWPAAAFKSPEEPIGICMLGQNPFGSALTDAVRGKVVGNRTLVVREAPNAQQAGKCHILFVAASERKRLRSVMEGIQGLSVLTVGETDNFIANGGVINFRLENARVRFEIDAGAAERSKLRISSKLLSLAQPAKK